MMDAIPRNLYVKPSAMYKVDKPEKVVGGYVATANSIPYQVRVMAEVFSGIHPRFCNYKHVVKSQSASTNQKFNRIL